MKGGEGTSLLSLNTFLHLGILRRVWLGKEKYELAQEKRKEIIKKPDKSHFYRAGIVMIIYLLNA